MTPDFMLLGELDVRIADARWTPPPPKPRRLLTALLLEPGRRVPRDRLVDLVWDGHPPRTARNTLQVYACQLRATLPRVDLTHRRGGYLLDIDPEAVDLYRFRSMVARSVGAGPATAAALLRGALGVFRGRPLAGLGPGRLTRENVSAIDEERRAAAQRLADVEARLADHGGRSTIGRAAVW